MYLSRCIPGRIRHALKELPTTLDATYARTLEEIDEQTWEYAHRLFQCVAAASRPLRAEELAEFLAFDFEAGSTPTFLADWRSEDPENEVLSICSTLLVIVKPRSGSPVIQFAHFSVKEYLTSARLAEAKNTLSRFHISLTLAHTVIGQACLGVLLHLDEDITKNRLKQFPLAEYAAEHWVNHARFENVWLKVQDGIKRLFDPRKSHLSIWVWIYDPEEHRRRSERSERPSQVRAIPLLYAAFCGLHDITTFLIVEHSQDVNARGFAKRETPLHVASRCGHIDVAQLLLEHGADADARDNDDCTPLLRASQEGPAGLALFLLKHGVDIEARDTQDSTPLGRAAIRGNVELARVLLEHGANVNSQNNKRSTPLHSASDRGNLGLAQMLLGHGADANARKKNNQTPLHLAYMNKVARTLLEHGADPSALDINNRTPLHRVSKFGLVGVARVLLEHGADANARDANNATPLHLASSSNFGEERRLNTVRLLLEYGSDIHARDDVGRTPFNRAAERNYHLTMQLLSGHGAEDHRV